MNTPYRVAACQMVSTPRIDENLRTADRLIAEAAAAGAMLVGLPEYFCLMGQRDEDKVRAREPLARDDDPRSGGPIQGFLSDAARRHRVWLVGGTVPLAAPEPDKVLNTTLVFDPTGRRVARYDKIHLFSFSRNGESYDESRTIAPGAGLGVFEAPFGRVGLSICYDLRFPELYRAMVAQHGDLKLLMVPAAFTATTGSAHWEILLRARAIENLCYVAGLNRVGRDGNGLAYSGDSAVIDFLGAPLSECTDEEVVVTTTLLAAELAAHRERFPALRDGDAFTLGER